MLGISATKTAMALLFSNAFAAAYPVDGIIKVARDDTPAVVLGEHASHRTIVVVFCMSYAFVLALAQGKLPSGLTLVLQSLIPYRLSSWPIGWTQIGRQVL